MINKKDLKKKLSELEFNVTQNSATEKAFSGKFYDFFENGIYHCICCGFKLFESKDKFKSLSGWPSFSKALVNSIEYIEDNSYGMKRIEVKCNNCDAHLGHLFDDGPKPSKKRYCINSVSMSFKKNGL